MAASSQILITVHGVNCDPWQERVRRVFAPHFDYQPIGYRRYQWCTGAAEAVFGIWTARFALLGLAIATGLAAWGVYWHRSLGWDALIALGGALVLLAAGARLGRRQRDRAMEELAAQIGEVTKGAGPPHVIAHSFGAYLAGRALLNRPFVRFRRVVLVGAALPCRYDWAGLLRKRRGAVEAVRNEHGGRDLVIWLVGVVERLARDMGQAGYKGFDSRAGFVHNGTSPVEVCRQCAGQVPVAVHNVPLDDYRHSTAFLNLRHAHELWLPVLWGFTPAEFQEWVILCWDSWFFDQRDRLVDLASTVVELASREWTWCRIRQNKCSLEQYLRDSIVRAVEKAGRRPLSADEANGAVKKALKRLYELVNNAYRESWQVEAPDPTLVQSLNPPTAIISVVKGVLRVLPP